MANKDSTSNKTTKEACKVAPATPKARTRRKTKSAPNPKVVANIVFINPETRKQQAYKDWQKTLREYVHTLSNDEVTLVRKCMTFICAEPDKRDYLHGKCPVIPFSAIRK
ncbi:MAG: hypothetical protein LZF63_06780 [Nitrosomonas sp.]|nr:hypothetical protein [Nitrosomonas sp.]MCG7756350.1 hypothetical protein [Nitrosomonas sp.]